MLRIRVLGDLRVELDGVGIDAPASRRAQALLGWLALHPGPHVRGRLASRFWPDVLETSARASLRVALSEVRAALGPAARFIEADRTRVGLATGVWVDALAFDELVAGGDLAGALTLATGELLPDLDDDWVLDARDEQRLAVVAALGAYAAQREAAGDVDQAIALSRRAVALDPLGEATARELMRRLAVAGETAAAADVAARLTARLASALGATPSAETRELVASLRATRPDAPALPEVHELTLSHFEWTLERAPDDPARRADVLVALGEARMRAGATAAGRQALAEGAALARALGDTQLLARAALGAAGVGVTVVDYDERVIAVLREALDVVGLHDPLRADLLTRLAIASAYDPDRTATRRLARDAVDAARARGDAGALARALGASHVALWGPDAFDERGRVAREMLAAAERAGDAATAVQARHWLALDRLESGDVAGFDAELGHYERAARSAELPALAWYVPLWRAMRATIAGRADEARRLAAAARAEGTQAGDANAELFWRIQVSTILVLSGRSAELDLAWAEDHARRSPAGLAWWTSLAWLWAERGRRAEAEDAVERVMAAGLMTLPRDVNWASAVAELAEACALLGDARRAAIVHDALLPLAGRIVLAARGAQAWGPADHFLGVAAATADRRRAARAHLAAALELAEDCGATLWARRTRAAQRGVTGDEPASRPAPGS